MKKDIDIPKVKDVHVVAVLEKHDTYQTMDWNVYVINDKNEPIDTVLIVSQGFDKKKTTSVMRHRLKVLPAKSFAKIEFLENQLLKVENRFSVSFFSAGKMYHKDFVFDKGSLKEEECHRLPLMTKKGVIAG